MVLADGKLAETGIDQECLNNHATGCFDMLFGNPGHRFAIASNDRLTEATMLRSSLWGLVRSPGHTKMDKPV